MGALHVFQDSRHIEKHSRTDYKSQQKIVFVLPITASGTHMIKYSHRANSWNNRTLVYSFSQNIQNLAYFVLKTLLDDNFDYFQEILKKKLKNLINAQDQRMHRPDFFSKKE